MAGGAELDALSHELRAVETPAKEDVN